MLSQAHLYQHNQHTLRYDLTAFNDLYRSYESHWVERVMLTLPEADPQSGGLNTVADLMDAIDVLVQAEAETESDTVHYVSHRMEREEFRILVQEFALDGLTEAQAFYFIMPRLPLAAQLPMLRILIDEFGSANSKRMHTALYVNLLEELAMPVDREHYVNCISESSFAFVNQFYWLTLRAEDPSYFAGAITYLESVIPFFFPCYVNACKRLGIAAHHYYSEHCHIDHFHALEGKRLLQAMDREQCLDLDKAWSGVRFSQHITQEAFDQAVTKARSQKEKQHAHNAA